VGIRFNDSNLRSNWLYNAHQVSETPCEGGDVWADALRGRLSPNADGNNKTQNLHRRTRFVAIPPSSQT